MANKYRKYAGTTLAKRLDEINADGSPLKDLTDEIELSRTLLIDAIALHERCAALPHGDKRVHAMIEAGRIVQDQLREISDLVVKFAKVESDTASISLMQAQRLITQIVAAIAKPIDDALAPLGLESGPVIAAVAVAIKNCKVVDVITDEDDVIDERVQYAEHPAALADDMDSSVPYVTLSLPAPASPRDGVEQPKKHAAGG